jgi:hypothetical protein
MEADGILQLMEPVRPCIHCGYDREQEIATNEELWRDSYSTPGDSQRAAEFAPAPCSLLSAIIRVGRARVAATYLNAYSALAGGNQPKPIGYAHTATPQERIAEVVK